MNMIDAVINLLIFGITVFLIVRYTRESGKWDSERIRKTFRFYTCQSNALCAGAALLMALFRLAGNVPEWVWILKYIGTAAVTVTMLTVFLFLAPSVGKEWYGILLKGNSNLFMHLLTPLAALVSFCVFEKRAIPSKVSGRFFRSTLLTPSVCSAAALIRAMSSGAARSASGSAARAAQKAGSSISSVTPGIRPAGRAPASAEKGCRYRFV